jgi:hypothetical protein
LYKAELLPAGAPSATDARYTVPSTGSFDEGLVDSATAARFIAEHSVPDLP